MQHYRDFIPTPKVFWSFETGKAFKKCSLFDRVISEDAGWRVERNMRAIETNCHHEGLLVLLS